MKTERDVSLLKYNTFGLDYTADYLIHLHTEKDAVDFLKRDQARKEKMLIIGGGSNLLFTGNYHGTLLYPDIPGIEIITSDGDQVIVSAGAGVVWDKLVEWTVGEGLGGLENLSLIPGNVGASPVQNIGAYGTEVRDLIEKVETISIESGEKRYFSNAECGFSYRSSIFKTVEKGKYLVTKVYFRLSVKPVFNLEYGTLRDEVERSGGISLLNVRRAVIKTRRSKLPDPEEIGNAGSFFKNPVVNDSVAMSIKHENPGMPLFPEKHGFAKLAAGWLIEQCGWKGKRYGDAGVYEKQALIIVNHGKASGSELFNLSESIRKSVQERFGIRLEREVEVVPSI